MFSDKGAQLSRQDKVSPLVQRQLHKSFLHVRKLSFVCLSFIVFFNVCLWIEQTNYLETSNFSSYLLFLVQFFWTFDQYLFVNLTNQLISYWCVQFNTFLKFVQLFVTNVFKLFIAFTSINFLKTHLFVTIPQMRLKWGNFVECAPSLSIGRR